MNLFNQIKEQITARQVAEGYGLAVGRNGMACCPFHDDKHPSLKVDKGFIVLVVVKKEMQSHM